MLQTLIIFNTIINTLILAWVLWHEIGYRIEIRWNKTFWHKKIFGITVYWFNRSHTTGNGITFNFRKEPEDEI